MARRLWPRRKAAPPTPAEGGAGPPAEQAGATFRGRAPAGRAEDVARAVADPLDGRWDTTSRYGRRARLTGNDALTPTGTVRLSFEVVDDEPFEFVPGHFVGVEAEVPGAGRRHSPYCILSAPDGRRAFDVLIRVIAQAPLSGYLADREPGDPVAFRGPLGRTMVPKAPTGDLVLLATGVGISPYLSLLHHLVGTEHHQSIRLWWGLRLASDICLVDELDALTRSLPDFAWSVSLSQPPEGWTGLAGRLTESVPPLLATLGDKRFYLSGNGAMIAEMAAALSDLGVRRSDMHTEAFFDGRHNPAPDTVARIRDRFVAHDLFSPYTHRLAGGFEPTAGDDPEARPADQ